MIAVRNEGHGAPLQKSGVAHPRIP